MKIVSLQDYDDARYRNLLKVIFDNLKKVRLRFLCQIEPKKTMED